MAWLIVLSNRRAAEWVLAEGRMAFRAKARPERIQKGDSFAIYVSRSAHGNPTRDEAQLVAVGQIASPVRTTPTNIAGSGSFDAVCDLEFHHELALRRGAPFRPLVDQLRFIRVKKSWAMYVRQTIVHLDDSDFGILEAAVSAVAAERSAASR